MRGVFDWPAFGVPIQFSSLDVETHMVNVAGFSESGVPPNTVSSE